MPISCRTLPPLLLLGACLGCRRFVRRPRGPEDGVHHHRQLARREGELPQPPARRRLPLRRAGRARPPRLAGLGLPKRRSRATRSSSPATSTAARSSTPTASTQTSTCSVEEMERASCSDSCPGVFSQLKEVYLFGCNTLKPEPRQVAAEEITRSLLRSGQSPAEPRASRACSASSTREQPRPHAAHLQGRAGDLRFFVLAPLGPLCRAAARSLLPDARRASRSAAARSAPIC